MRLTAQVRLTPAYVTRLARPSGDMVNYTRTSPSFIGWVAQPTRRLLMGEKLLIIEQSTNLRRRPPL